MSRPQRAGLREGIIQTSLEIGSELGEEGLTMRGIAARLGVSATALYQHFESKASILREIRLYGADLLQTEVIDKAASPRRPGRLPGRGGAAIRCVRPNAQVAVLGDDGARAARLDGDVAEELELMLRPLQGVPGRGCARAPSQGCWRRGLHVESAAFRLWLSMHGLCSMLNSGRIDERHPAFPFADQDTFVDHFIADTVQALRAEPAA
jgi:AcrR family transcriptional regulator